MPCVHKWTSASASKSTGSVSFARLFISRDFCYCTTSSRHGPDQGVQDELSGVVGTASVLEDVHPSIEELIYEYLKLTLQERFDICENHASYILNDVSHGQENVVASSHSQFDEFGDSHEDTTGDIFASNIIECIAQIIQDDFNDDEELSYFGDTFEHLSLQEHSKIVDVK